MNDPNEPSYYEIALTRRQVTVAFVVLLVCMILSFLAGVWTVRAGLPAQAAVAAVPAAPAEGAKLPEYQFFNDGAAAKGTPRAAANGAVAPAAGAAENSPPPPAAIGPTDQTLLADIGGTEEAAAAAAGSSNPEDAEASAPSTAVDAAPAPGASPVPPIAASPLPPIRSPAPATPAPNAVASDAGANGSVYRELQPGEMAVQVFSSSDEKQARAILRQLRAAGYQVFLTPGSTGASRMFRVRIGPYTDRAVAQKVADDVKRRFKFDPWIAK